MDYVVFENLPEWIEGYSVWEADKPVMLLQYGGNQADGSWVFQWVAPPEQYLCEHWYYQWQSGGFSNQANIVTVSEQGEESIKGIEYDGEPL